MRVLVGCEYSGTVRDAFIRAGHDAMSCDLLPSESELGPHYQGDVFDIIGDGWDLAVFHQPCTYLTSAGNRWLYEEGEGKNGEPFGPPRWKALIEGAVFFRELLNADIPRVAVENPKMNRHGKAIIGQDCDQMLQPWQFGHPELKGVGLWLRNLPPLTPTKNVHDEMMALPYKQRAKVHSASPSKDRAKKRSLFFRGIADAMASQWGELDNVRGVA